ncbi:MAG: WD40 repeat domain-containing protein [Campylobacterota bacterium]|nr:WD40 repeat domain-containing protein [Campylobacterota bacterium]
MGKLFLITLLFVITLNSKDLKPTYVYEASGGVTDIVSIDNKIYVATDASGVDVFDLKTKKLINKIKVPQIKDFMGDVIDAKIYNVDVYKDKVLLTAQAPKGFREVHIYQNNKIETVITIEKRMFVSKAKFINDEEILFSLLSNEMYLFNYKTKKIIWQISVKPDDATFNSTFADFALNEEKTHAVVADESGDLKIVDIKKAKVIKVLADKNLDKVFKVDIKNDKIITAGQDGRCVVYNLSNNSDYSLRKEHWFLIYGAGLSPSGKIGAYSSDENNNVTVFNTKTKTKIYKLTNNLMTLSAILFINENEIFVTTDSNKFNYYNLTK